MFNIHLQLYDPRCLNCITNWPASVEPPEPELELADDDPIPVAVVLAGGGDGVCVGVNARLEDLFFGVVVVALSFVTHTRISTRITRAIHIISNIH